jgi:FkbM family methyltransferase
MYVSNMHYPGPTSFGRQFAESFSRALASRHGDSENLDALRFPSALPARLTNVVRDTIDASLHRAGLVRHAPLSGNVGWSLGEVLENFSGLGRLYDMLNDDRSREILVELLVYRVLGRKHVRLSRNDASHSKIFSDLRNKRVVTGPSNFANPISGGRLELIDLSSLGHDIRIHGLLLGVRCEFVLRQYQLVREDQRIAVEAGDVVIDGGACWGDTALHFADDAGELGRVVAFEFIPPNLEVFRANLALNPSLATRIDLVQHPIWSKAGVSLSVSIAGPASRVLGGKSGAGDSVSVSTETIDEVLGRRLSDRVDFIKLDIEGAELEALKGAERSIRRYRPKLAICLYHSLKDFVEIPAWLDSLGLGYKMFIDHFTIHAEETVLFAAPTDRIVTP